jgi:hypothetical protein
LLLLSVRHFSWLAALRRLFVRLHLVRQSSLE